jgi:carbon storage regulator CsrA
MLNLSRQKSEAIVITVGKKVIRLVVGKIAGNRVVLGLEADRDVVIHRAEVVERIEKGAA